MNNQEKEQDNKLETYFIPQNIVENKTFLGGWITTRKLVEAIIFSFIALKIAMYISGFLMLSIQNMICLSVISVGLVATISIAGINGDSITGFLIKYLRYKNIKKYYSFLGEKGLEAWEKKVLEKKNAREKKLYKENKKKKIKKTNVEPQVQSTDESMNSKSWWQARKEMKQIRKRKIEEEKIKASLIADGMDPIEVAAIDVFQKDKEKDANVQKKDTVLKDNLFFNRMKEVIDMYQKYQQNPYADEPEGLPPITTETVDFLPFRAMYNGIYETKDSRLVKFLEIKPTNFDLRDANEKLQIITSFFSYLKIAPVNLQIKCVSKKVDTRHHVKTAKKYMEEETNDKCREMQLDNIRMLESMAETGTIEHKFYLIFDCWLMSRNLEHWTECSDKLEKITADAIKYLSECDLEVVVPDNNTIFAAETLYTYLNRSESVHSEFAKRKQDVADYYRLTFPTKEQLSDVPINELIAPQMINFEESPRYYIVDGRYYTHFYVNGSSINTKKLAGWTSNLINSEEGVDVDFYFSQQNKTTMINKLNMGISIKGSSLIGKDTSAEDYDSIAGRWVSSMYIRSGLQNKQDFYYMSILITISADSLNDLDRKVDSFKTKCQSKDYHLENCNYIQDKAFLSSLPLCKIDKQIEARAKRNMLTEGVASTFPFISNELSDENGILIGIDEIYNMLVILDLFDDNKYSNANISIFGTSGAGKTYLLLLLAMRMREQRIPIYIIAPLKAFEFKRSCDAIGGQFITISSASNQCINCMEIRLADSSVSDLLDGTEKGMELSALAQKIESLKTLFSLIKPDITKKELNILDKALIRVYNKKGITYDNDSLFIPGTKEYREMPILGDLYEEIKESDPIRAEDLLESMYKYVYGSAKNFNQQTNVDLDNMYTVFDVEHLEKEILPVGMFIVTEFVWLKAKEDRTKKKCVIMDELWRLIGINGIVAEYIIEIFKIIRSYGGSAIAATQSSNDIKKLDNGKYGKEIVGCSSLKFILRLEKSEAINIQDIFDFTEAEITKIKRFKQGHGLLMCGENNIPIQIFANKKEHDLITTKRSDSEKLANERRKMLKDVS